MKILVAYYSRTGTTRTVGEALAKELGADRDEIVDLKKRTGLRPIRFLIAGRDAMARKLTDIRFERPAEEYDLVVIGTPVWAGRITPAVRTYLSSQRLEGKRVAFFCTNEFSHEGVFEEMKKMIPNSIFVGALGVPAKEVKSGAYVEKVKQFADNLRKQTAPNP
jgi:flavodoxin